MIQVLRDLSEPGYSVSSASESMDLNDSVLGKRQGGEVYEQGQVENAEKALVPFIDRPTGGIPKRGKLDHDLESSVKGSTRDVTAIVAWSVRLLWRQLA